MDLIAILLLGILAFIAIYLLPIDATKRDWLFFILIMIILLKIFYIL